MMLTLFLVLAVAPLAQAFAPTALPGASSAVFGYRASVVKNTIVLNAAVSYDDISDIGYEVEVSKPLGVIFGENADPYYGIVVDDVEPGLNGGTAGLRLGDQLVSVNGQPVVGQGFDEIMGMLQTATGDLELQLYRGNVRSLYVILENRSGDNPTAQEDDEGGEDEVIMDENYESPVQIDVSQYNTDPLSLGDVVNAFKNVGKNLTEKKEEEAPAASAATPKEETKKSGGIFGMFKQESVQLDGDDASGLK
eukprot:CAMPEP_0119007772 /NCGR_PEP_ID=MMETSP1176-20130426/3242_1 /TAXON_ID=265551 /ORGANISM="Synedropsis recta cf, Strain CCMP1620" /LENGTH=250 /DNA_ID=CAMNT_0006959985 /DNA_START=17 /DNA_END=769 /DNA_ORIENTATION=-